jgi:hypothetical protein
MSGDLPLPVAPPFLQHSINRKFALKCTLSFIAAVLLHPEEVFCLKNFTYFSNLHLLFT